MNKKQARAFIEITEFEDSVITGLPKIKSVRVLEFPPPMELLYLAEKYASEVDARELINNAMRHMDTK